MEQQINILSLRGYFQRHFELCRNAKTQEDAYECLEAELKAKGSPPRYRTYDSFRKAKCLYNKSKSNRL